jgi:hypothetical protein
MFETQFTVGTGLKPAFADKDRLVQPFEAWIVSFKLPVRTDSLIREARRCRISSPASFVRWLRPYRSNARKEWLPQYPEFVAEHPFLHIRRYRESSNLQPNQAESRKAEDPGLRQRLFENTVFDALSCEARHKAEKH